MTRTTAMCGVLFGAMCLVIGCGRPSAPPAATTNPSAPMIDGTKFVMAEEPAGAKTVLEVREEAKDGDSVIIVGRIGGDVDPWVTDRASFLIVDSTLIPCSERKGDNCPTPWDYCCDSDVLAKSKATIKFVDDAGKTLPSDARQLFNVKELQTVVVKGQAKRDEAGNLTVLASGLFVRSNSEAKTQ